VGNTLGDLRGKIGGADDLKTVVRSMKSLAASSVGQYEESVRAMDDYDHTVQLGLAACLRQSGADAGDQARRSSVGPISAVVFGSDQGLVGRFNDVLADFVVEALASLPGRKNVWAVGERVHARLSDAGLAPAGLYAVPISVDAITPLVGQILIDSEAQPAGDRATPLYIFHNAPMSGALYEPQSRRSSAVRGLCGRLFGSTCSSRCSGPVPNPSPVRTRAAWPQCSEPRRISIICWTASIGRSTASAKAPSMRICSTSFPVSRRRRGAINCRVNPSRKSRKHPGPENGPGAVLLSG